MSRTFIVKTLGCKVNQYESDGIATELEKAGYERKTGRREKDSSVDLCIVNTCAVTSKAAMQSRQAVRKLIRDNPNAAVIVTGCHAQTSPLEIRKIKGVDHIIGHKDKTTICDQILSSNFRDIELPARRPDTITVCDIEHFSSFEPAVSGQMTRAYLKIQDGCNAFCAYCIVPYARGKSVSMPEKQVLAHLYSLDRKGYSEVILTGIHTGLYGLDLAPGSSIVGLIDRITEQRPVKRIRISSIEPGEISSGLIRRIKEFPMICRHLHIPLQSGDSRVLRDMGRPYDPVFFRDKVIEIKEQIPQACIGVDVMVGFPTEDQPAFDRTFSLIEGLPVSYLHVFPYSPRKGTRAYSLQNKSPDSAIHRRCEQLRHLSRKKRQRFFADCVGQSFQGLFQHKRHARTGRLVAITDNYISVLVDGPDDLKGKLGSVIPETIDSDQYTCGRRL